MDISKKMENKKQFFKDTIGWGAGLWFVGWVLGIIAFMVVAPNMIGWVVSPIGILITLWVLIKVIKGENLNYYLKIAIAWTIIAVVCDYLFNVLLFDIGAGYYKLDIYIYYATTFVLPLLVGYFKTKK
ncbi:MAG: hypothetical protein NTW11_00795 [Candidatus Staskawiczbacteria bacterium]|nr:hypothetical protein [Candidatus Staskawiczbacteria bacterium]